MGKLKSYKDWEIENLANLTALTFPSPACPRVRGEQGRAREGAEITVPPYHQSPIAKGQRPTAKSH